MFFQHPTVAVVQEYAHLKTEVSASMYRATQLEMCLFYSIFSHFVLAYMAVLESVY